MSDPKPPRRTRPAPPAGGGPPVIPGPRTPPPAAPAARPAPPPAPPIASADPGGVEGSRKLIRPSLDARASRAGAPTQRRREAPPDATGAEAAHVARLVSTGATVEVRLETGDLLVGQIEWCDRSCLKLRRRDGAPVLVMKQSIATLQARSESSRD